MILHPLFSRLRIPTVAVPTCVQLKTQSQSLAEREAALAAREEALKATERTLAEEVLHPFVWGGGGFRCLWHRL